MSVLSDVPNLKHHVVIYTVSDSVS